MSQQIEAYETRQRISEGVQPEDHVSERKVVGEKRRGSVVQYRAPLVYIQRDCGLADDDEAEDY